MGLSTAFQLQEVDCHDLVLWMRKPWYRYLYRNGSRKKRSVELLYTN